MVSTLSGENFNLNRDLGDRQVSKRKKGMSVICCLKKYLYWIGIFFMGLLTFDLRSQMTFCLVKKNQLVFSLKPRSLERMKLQFWMLFPPESSMSRAEAWDKVCAKPKDIDLTSAFQGDPAWIDWYSLEVFPQFCPWKFAEPPQKERIGFDPSFVPSLWIMLQRRNCEKLRGWIPVDFWWEKNVTSIPKSYQIKVI